jgi:predicted transcriptional regulator
MNKISSQDAASRLKQAGAAIRNLSQERRELQEKLASYEKKDRVVKIARDMEEKGLSSELTFEQKVATLEKAPRLDVTEEAIKLAAPQGRGFGDISDAPGGSASPFEHFIMTGEDPSET